MLGFDFDDNPGDHTIWLTEDFRADILEKLKKWIREGEHGKRGTPFEEFRNYLEKLRNVFISIPYGKGLLSPCNQVLGKELKIYIFTSKKNPIVGYLQLPSPPKPVEKNSNTVQGISHGMATLHQS